jgi:hypothetical protein
MQQTLKEFLESIDKPDPENYDWDDGFEFLDGQYDLAQHILSEYFTERNFE